MSALYPNAIDYLDASLRLIRLQKVVAGKCDCGNENCEAVGKHPAIKNWQIQPLISDATLQEVWIATYKATGLGWALDEDHIVVDVDPRNGGDESLKELQKDLGIDLFKYCNSIVKTGGGGVHFYFKKKSNEMLGWRLPEKYRGIDIKQHGGFVVIPGSFHVSGNDYEWYSAAKSDLENMSLLPEAIDAMLSKIHKEHRQAMQDAGMGDVVEISDMLEVIGNSDLDYEEWLRIGMAVHHATGGSAEGLKIFQKWGAKSKKHDPSDSDRRWHSFGRRANNLSTMGTLHYIATQAGWKPMADSTVLTEDQLADIKEQWSKKVINRVSLPSIGDDTDINIFEPPGLLGRINDYVYACSVFPNRNLALACSLSVLTNIIGRKYYLPGRFSNIQPNLLVLCIAGSSVGKDSVLGAAHKLLTSVGLGPAIHGRIKSEKDLLDALEQNQYAMYFNDEFGYFLQRLNNAMKKGSASYLEGIIGTIMEVFTKGDKSVLLDISRKKSIRESWETIIAKAATGIQDGSGDVIKMEKKKARAEMLMSKFMDGFPNPFLSMFTTATPRTMEIAFSGESTENGFLSRAMTFHEYETNPRPKPDYKGAPAVPTGLLMGLKSVAFEKDECPFGRIDSFDLEQVAITVDQDAQVYMDRAIDYFFELAETQKESGLESLPRRALDGIVKVCIAMAAQDRRLTLPMVRYAVKLVRSEIDKKIRRVNSTENMESRNTNEKMDGVAHRICEICDTDEGVTVAVIYQNCKRSGVKKEDIQKVVDGLAANGYLATLPCRRKQAGEEVFRYKSTGKQSS